MQDRFRTDCEEATRLFDSGKSDEAIAILTRLANEEYPPALVFLGWIWEMGEGRTQDVELARSLYERAALAGDAVGQFYLGSLLVRQGDVVAGVKWIREAAARDYAPAQYRLGRLYETGVGVDADHETAAKFMTKAASLGHPFAQRWVAIRGLKGRNGFRGVMQALKWFVFAPRLALRLHESEDQNLLAP